MKTNTKFGVELEFTNLDYDFAKYKLKYLRGAKQFTEFGGLWLYGKEWKLEKDTSIKPKLGFEGIELVSPILVVDDLQILCKIVNDLIEFGANSDDSCGMHVHVDGSCFDCNSLYKLQKMFIAQQDDIYKRFDCIQSNGKFKKYCKKLPASYAEKLFSLSDKSILSQAKLWYNELGTGYPVKANKTNIARYYGLNLHSYFVSHGTIEFRLFKNTKNVNDIIKAVLFCISFCEKALSKENTNGTENSCL